MRLIAENLGGERGGEAVFSGIDFVLEERQALIVTGPNGSGKSTLLRVIAGLLPVAQGNVRIEGTMKIEDGDEAFPSV
ncbi:ATP-binding cassette domain-containing protein, partial [Mesorhizobium sp. M7A.T.Ca.TU.009.01.1.1]